LEDHPAAAWIVVHHELQRRVGEETPVPIQLTLNLDGRKTRRQRTASHDVLRADRHLPAVEISEIAGLDVNSANAQTDFLSSVDAIEIDESFQRSSKRRCRVETDALVGWYPGLRMRAEETRLAERNCHNRTCPT